MLRRKRLTPTLRPAVALIALAAFACRPGGSATPAEPTAQPTAGGTAVIAASRDITGVNPLLDGGTRFNRDVLDLLFLRLLEEQPDFARHPPTFEPGLAARWQWSEDRLSLRIELREDLRWSDGEPITAEDVVWSYERQIDPEIAWPYASSQEAVAGMEVLDAATLRVRYTRASHTQLADLNQGPVLPRHLWSALPSAEWRSSGGWFVDNLVVSGPYRLAAWQPGEQIVLERNPAFHRRNRPLLDRLVFRIVPDRANQLAQLRSGTVDFVEFVPPAEAARVERDQRIELTGAPARQYSYICWNLDNPLFAEVEARQALTLAIDRQALVDALWFGRAAVAVSPILSSVWARDPDLEPWGHDPPRARALLAGLGWRDSDGDGVLDRSGLRFSFGLLTTARNQLRSDAAVMIQQDLRQIGVEARVRQLAWPTQVERSYAGDFDASIAAWTVDTSLNLKHAFHSDSIDGGQNFGGYANPEADRLIDLARASSEPAELARLLSRLQQILHHDQPYTFLWEPQQLNAHRRRLRGVAPNGLSSFFGLEEWWLAPPA